METGTSRKFNPLYILVVLIILVGLFFLFGLKRVTPYQVLTPDSYPENTRISLYKEVPPGFPLEIVLEGKALNYAGTVVTPNVKNKITVSYVSDKMLPELVTMYEGNFTSNGWTITTKSVTAKVGVFQAEKDGGRVILTIAPLSASEMMLTFQYEK